nr:MAG TPA: hypothetical protein [Caudoviricetes sp.]
MLRATKTVATPLSQWFTCNKQDFSHFRMRRDYIIHHAVYYSLGSHTSDTCPTSISALVVEGKAIRPFPADCPIHKLFKPLPFKLISSFRFGIVTLRGFQHIRENTLHSFQM